MMFGSPPPPPKQQGAFAQTVSAVVKLGQEVFHWGFIPAVIYLGFKKGADAGESFSIDWHYSLPLMLSFVTGMPELTWENLLWK
jgi:hypothetical protein